MKAVLVKEYGSIENLSLEEINIPDISDNEVLIKVKVAGVNYPDVLITKGLYQFKPEIPFSPGGEVAGLVEKVGKGVNGFKPGDRVIAAAGWGGFSEYAVYQQENCFHLPESIPFEDGAVLLETYATAIHALKDRGGLKSGETLTVLGAAGGTGTAAIQIGKLLNARVIAVGSSEEKLRFSKENGADHLIDYSQRDLKSELKKLEGTDVIFDPVGGEASEDAFRAIKSNGRHLVVGFASGSIPSLPWNLPLLKSASIVGVFWGGFWRTEPQKNKENVQLLLQWLQENKIKPSVKYRFIPDRAKEALKLLDERKILGKAVIVF